MCARVCHINRELQMLPLLLLCDIPIHFDAQPSSAHANIKTHTCIAYDSWSLIKSLAFVIIENWLKNKAGIHGIKKKTGGGGRGVVQLCS